ncbi:MAG TPA: hypothetical protein VEJ63_06645 [Planctomycetota bacterium]|nr:hypothetical protein [Planctomycetota bacterium]
MRIFFCERCRKRLTDDDVAKGLAVDKKFNGVYCKGCAEGVEVLDSWAHPQHQKQAAARKTTPHGGQAVAVATPATQTVAAQRKKAVYARSASAHSAPHTRDSGGYIKAPAQAKRHTQPLSVKTCIVLGASVILAGAGMFVGFSGKGAGAESKRPPAPAAIEAQGEPVNTFKKKSDPANAEKAFDRLMQDWKSLSPTAQQQRAEEFLADHNDAMVAGRVRQMLQDLKK